MKVPKRPQPGPVGTVFGLLGVFAFVGIIGSCAITIGIWPGELKLLAPIFCSDAQPDAFVVAVTQRVCSLNSDSFVRYSSGHEFNQQLAKLGRFA